MAALKPTLVVACALVDADERVLIAQRPEGKPLAGFGNFPAARSSRASGPPRVGVPTPSSSPRTKVPGPGSKLDGQLARTPWVRAYSTERNWSTPAPRRHLEHLLEAAPGQLRGDARDVGLGCRVLQLRSVEYARTHGVRIHCRSSFDPGPGTFVPRRRRDHGTPAHHGRHPLDRRRRGLPSSAFRTGRARRRRSSWCSPTPTATSTRSSRTSR